MIGENFPGKRADFRGNRFLKAHFRFNQVGFFPLPLLTETPWSSRELYCQKLLPLEKPIKWAAQDLDQQHIHVSVWCCQGRSAFTECRSSSHKSQILCARCLLLCAESQIVKAQPLAAMTKILRGDTASEGLLPTSWFPSQLSGSAQLSWGLSPSLSLGYLPPNLSCWEKHLLVTATKIVLGKGSEIPLTTAKINTKPVPIVLHIQTGVLRLVVFCFRLDWGLVFFPLGIFSSQHDLKDWPCFKKINWY